MKMDIDLKSLCANLETKMNSQLQLLEREEEDVVSRCNKSLVHIAMVLHELKGYLADYEFKGKEEEIYFFKHQKPLFLSRYFFFDGLRALRIKEPNARNGARELFYEKQLDQLQTVASENWEFMQYCHSGSDILDDKYFRRGFLPETDVMTDRTFSTGYDERLGRLLANRLLKEQVAAILISAERNAPLGRSSMTWTGSKADLIELIYGLEAVGAINKGHADIKEIASAFESLFGINLGNLYRQFLDIRLRKKQKTCFLTDMNQKLAEKIQESDR